MKRFNLPKIVGVGALTLSLAILPSSLPSSAQTNTEPNTTTENTTSPTLDTTPFQETRDDNNNWGWLGLIGLLGLANLFRKPKQGAGYSDPDATTRP